MEDAGKKRKEKIKAWLKNYYNLGLIFVLVFSFAVLFYYFSMTKNQPLWWDEAEYMAMAKQWAFNTTSYENPQRPILLPFLASALYILGLKDASIKFLLEIIPMWLSVLFMYFLIKEMYDRKTALVSAFILSVSWIHIFYSMRFMTDSLGFMFGLLSFLFVWKGYIKKQSNKYIWLVGVFVALSFFCRLTGVLYGAIIVLFLLLTAQFEFLKNKHMWLIVIFFVLVISPMLLFDYFKFGNPLAFRAGYTTFGMKSSLGWWMVPLVYDYPELVFFILFLVGLFTLLPMFLSFDIMILKKDRKYYNDFFMLLAVIFTLAFFIYFLRQGENRWLMLMSIGIFTISAKGIIYAYENSKKYAGKSLALFVLALILLSGAYFQLKHADMIIKAKLDSYKPVKEAALWMKDNSFPEETMLSVSYTQTIFYSERPVYTFAGFNESRFDDLIKKVRPRYMMVSALEPNHPKWSYNMPEKYLSILKPVNAWFADAEGKQAILIIYELNSSMLPKSI